MKAMQNAKAASLTKRLFTTLLVLFITFALSFLVFYLFRAIVEEAYTALAKAFPESIPYYSRILQEEAYRQAHAVIDAIAAILALFAAAYLSVLLNSSKRHEFFKETQGLVTFRKGCSYYCKSYIVTDIIAAVIISLVLVLLTHLVPVFHTVSEYTDPAENRIVTAARTLMLPFSAIYSQIGLTLSFLALSAVSVLGSLAAIPHSVLHFRGDSLAHTLE